MAYLGQSSPGWTRTIGRHLVRVLPSPLGHGTVVVAADPPGVAPGSPACGAGVVLLDHEPVSTPEVRDSRPPARHAPKDLNPDQLGWNQPCCQLHQGHTNLFQRKSWDSNPQRQCRGLFSEQVPHPAGRLPSASCGSWNRTNASWFRARRHYQQQLPRSVRQTSASHGLQFAALRPGIALDLRASKAHATTTCRRECPAGIEPAYPAWETGA